MPRDPAYEIRVYDFDSPGNPFVIRRIAYDAASIRYTESFYAPGSFEINIPQGSPNAKAFQKYRFVEIGRRFHGMITGVQRQSQADGDMLTVTGQSLLGLLSQRLTLPPDIMGTTIMAGFDGILGPSETVIKHFVHNNVIAPLSEPRRIPGFVIAPDLGRGLPDDKYLSRFEPLTDVMEKVGKDAKLGLSCRMDISGGYFIFDVVQGVDRTAGQSTRPRIVFSLNRKTVLGMLHNDNDAGFRNAFYATKSGAEFEDEALTMTYYREADEPEPPAGFYRREVYMDVSAEHPIAGQEYDELKRLALINARNYERLINFTGDVNYAAVRYGADYDLGDLVTVQNLDWGITMDIELVGMTVELNGASDTYTATFGEQKPSFIRTIKKAIQMG